MATTAPARRAARPQYADRPIAQPAPRRTARPRPRAAARPGLGRALTVFVVCLTLLAAGRVALSFAVVQKTLQTDTIARQERQVIADNARLQEELAQASSSVNIMHLARRELGLVTPSHTRYITAPHVHVAKGGSGR
jgi:hypothetical protein